MKSFLLTIIVCALLTGIASAQTAYLPSFQIGIKGGANYSQIPAVSSFRNQGQLGYIAGVWARLGGAGLNFQPELYINTKNVIISATNGGTNYTNHARFTNADVPLLVGGKVGNADFGIRFYAGPVVSFGISRIQDFAPTTNVAMRLNYKDENLAAQAGAGIDIKEFAIDLRYEHGINKVNYGIGNEQHTRLNFFTFTIAYSLYSDY